MKNFVFQTDDENLQKKKIEILKVNLTLEQFSRFMMKAPDLHLTYIRNLLIL